MNRSELERPSSGEAYVTLLGTGTIKKDEAAEWNKHSGWLPRDSPSAPVQPLKIGFGVKNEKT